MFSTGFHRQRVVLLAFFLAGLSGGCAYHGYGIPAECIEAPNISDAPRSNKEPINYIRLRQDPPPVYLLAARDILGIYVEGVMGRRGDPPPVHFPKNENVPPAIGYPVPIREDGTISLPLLPSIRLAGLTLAQAEQEIRKAYTVHRNILQPGRDRIIVTLIEPRTYHVVVIREDTITDRPLATIRQGEVILEPQKRGQTHAVVLRAYENDVLHALSASGGLPGVDAKNTIKILRGDYEDVTEWEQSTRAIEDPLVREELMAGNPNVITIPLSSGPGDPPVEITQDDILLADGDIVLVESRESEVFYTGGLLKGGQYLLPRDYDLDVLGAMAMAGGSVARAAGGSGSSGAFGGGGGAICPPTRVIILRTINGRQVPIKISLKRALVDPTDRILIQPNDFILLEYTHTELIFNFIAGAFQLNYFLNNF